MKIEDIDKLKDEDFIWTNIYKLSYYLIKNIKIIFLKDLFKRLI